MKKLILRSLPFFIITLLSFQIGCNKEVVNNSPCPTPTYQISGLWTGTYTVDGSSQSPLFYSFTIFPDGSILTKGKVSTGDDAYSQGTWTLTDSTFSATITTLATPAITQSITGTYSNTGTLTNATWAVTSSPYPFNSGTFVNMLRIN